MKDKRVRTQPVYTVTTSIPYVNARPHIGHALEYVQGDVLARYYRQRGADVYFQSGTDENALKNAQAAEKLGVPTTEFVAQNAAAFLELGTLLNLSFDYFIRTSIEERHREGVFKFWQACGARGDIYTKRYSGLYCVGCEMFYTEDELVDGRCPDHGTEPDLVEEENYFFRLSRYQNSLCELIESDQLRIVPQTRKNEVLSFIRRGLEDFSISRSRARARGWGIPVPDDPAQVIYVWFDALINYITGLGYADASPAYRRYWLESERRIHGIGKNIIRFHAIYWPAMLLSAGVPLPHELFVHGFINIEGRKISKSLGNVIDPVELVAQLGTDAFRYYLLRKIPATADANFAREEYLAAYNGELADQLGNLVNRVVTMIGRYCDGIIPQPTVYAAIDQQLIAKASTTADEIDAALTDFALHQAMSAIWVLIAATNKYVVEVEPWVLAKERGTDIYVAERLGTTLYTLAEILRLLSYYLAPFLPGTAAAIGEQLGTPLAGHAEWAQVRTWGQLAPGTRIGESKVLFPKV